MAALIMSMCWKPSSHVSLCSYSSTLSSSLFSELLIAHTISRISDFIIYFGRKNLAYYLLLDLEEVSSMIEPVLLDSWKTTPMKR
jgi:hypothetical protein